MDKRYFDFSDESLVSARPSHYEAHRPPSREI
jgi:hypothetical protein